MACWQVPTAESGTGQGTDKQLPEAGTEQTTAPPVVTAALASGHAHVAKSGPTAGRCRLPSAPSPSPECLLLSRPLAILR